MYSAMEQKRKMKMPMTCFGDCHELRGESFTLLPCMCAPLLR